MNPVPLGLQAPPAPHRGGEIIQHVHGGLPIDARVRDGHASLERLLAFLGHVLPPFVDVALDHNANDSVLAAAHLLGDGFGDDRLVLSSLVQ